MDAQRRCQTGQNCSPWGEMLYLPVAEAAFAHRLRLAAFKRLAIELRAAMSQMGQKAALNELAGCGKTSTTDIIRLLDQNMAPAARGRAMRTPRLSNRAILDTSSPTSAASLKASCWARGAARSFRIAVNDRSIVVFGGASPYFRLIAKFGDLDVRGRQLDPNEGKDILVKHGDIEIDVVPD